MSFLSSEEERDELFYVAFATIEEFLPKLIRDKEILNWIETSEAKQQLKGIFVQEYEELELRDRERAAKPVSERQIASAIIYGGANGFVNLMSARMVTQEEMIDRMAGVIPKAFSKYWPEKFGLDEEKILIGLIKKELEKGVRAIAARIGQEPGIAY